MRLSSLQSGRLIAHTLGGFDLAVFVQLACQSFGSGLARELCSIDPCLRLIGTLTKAARTASRASERISLPARLIEHIGMGLLRIARELAKRLGKLVQTGQIACICGRIRADEALRIGPDKLRAASLESSAAGLLCDGGRERAHRFALAQHREHRLAPGQPQLALLACHKRLVSSASAPRLVSSDTASPRSC